LREGCAIIYEREAVAHEETAPSVRAEFRRRSRIGAGGFQVLARLAGLFNPRHGWVTFTFLSHKVLRWLCPFFLLALLACNLVLAGEPTYLGLLRAQIAFFCLALRGAGVPGRSRPVKVLRLATMFVSMNAALLVGFWRWLRGTQKAAWKRTVRTAEQVPAVPALPVVLAPVPAP